MYNKRSGRVTFKSNRRPGFKKNNYLNTKGRNKGNVNQQYNKYLKLAKEAFTYGDRVKSEYYYQFTDHYYRLMVELGINVEENANENTESTKSESITEDQSDQLKDGYIEKNEKKENKADNAEVEDEVLDVEDRESIVSIPFIAEPAKKKRVKSTK